MSKERRDQLREAQKATREYQKLLELPGWRMLQEEIAAQINSSRDQIEGNLATSMDDMVKRESVLGEIRTGRRIIQLPEEMLAAAKETVTLLLMEEQPEEEREDVDSDQREFDYE